MTICIEYSSEDGKVEKEFASVADAENFIKANLSHVSLEVSFSKFGLQIMYYKGSDKYREWPSGPFFKSLPDREKFYLERDYSPVENKVYRLYSATDCQVVDINLEENRVWYKMLNSLGKPCPFEPLSSDYFAFQITSYRASKGWI